MDDASRELLARSETIAKEPALVDVAARLFDFTQFLLDDEENVTPAGNLTGKAREKLRVRLVELLDASEAE